MDFSHSLQLRVCHFVNPQALSTSNIVTSSAYNINNGSVKITGLEEWESAGFAKLFGT
jgi:hypothetical protein